MSSSRRSLPSNRLSSASWPINHGNAFTARLARSVIGAARLTSSRPQYIAGDDLPASTTFVWDAISDNLVTVAKAGATSGEPQGGIVKQIVHGGLSYDDPIETVTVDPLAPSQLSYLYPVYDEVGAGHLEAVLNRQSELVARNVTTDPYGHGSLDLAGPAVDRISLEAQKSESGDLTSVTITIGATEDIAAASVAAGTRLAAINSTGAVLRLAPVAAELDASDAASARWTLTGEEWTTFVAEATSISIAATSQLRGSAWGDQPFIAAPEWARASMPIHASAELPMEVRESLASITSFLDSVSASGVQKTTYWEADALALLGSETGGAGDKVMAARFQALPFVEPATGLIYARNRWYDPSTGTFLTPDPMGYADSSNLYSDAKGDPVNGRDPLGLQTGKIQPTRPLHPSEVLNLSPSELARLESEMLKKATEVPCGTPERCREAAVRSRGVARTVGGIGQTAVGVGAFTSTGPIPEPVSKTVGTIAVVRGVDNTAAGFMQAVTGKEYDTVTGRVAYLALVKSGVSPAKATEITGYAETTVDVLSTAGAGLIQAVNVPALPATVARTFERSKYTARVLKEDTVAYRGEGGQFGRYYGTTRPSSAAEAERLYNVTDYGNDLMEVSEYMIPKGTVVYEGPVAGGTGTQLYIPDPRAAGVKLIQTAPLPQYGH